MASKADYWHHVAEHSAKQFYEQNPGTPEISFQSGHRFICVTFDLPAAHEALCEWLSTELQKAGVRQVADAFHPPADQDSGRRAYAIVLDPEEEEWDWIEFLVGMVVLKSEELSATGRAPASVSSGRKRARSQRRRNRRRHVCVRSLIRQTRREPAVFVLD